MDMTAILGKLDGEVKKKILAAATAKEVKEIAGKAGIELSDDQAKLVQKALKEVSGKVSMEDLGKAADLLKNLK